MYPTKTKSPIVSVLILIIVLLVLGLIFVLNNKQDNKAVSPEIMETDKGDVEETEPSVMAPASSGYTDYSPSKLAFADEGKVVLFFNAKWCPTCRALTTDINNNITNIPEDVLILSVDYDKETALKQNYGVTYQHTLVQVDSGGNQIKKWSGSPTLQELITNIQ